MEWQDSPSVSATAETRADIVSWGGAVALFICLVVTAAFIVALFMPGTTGVQKGIAAILFLGSWLYLLRSASERLEIVERRLVFSASFARPQRFDIDEIEELRLERPGAAGLQVLTVCLSRGRVEGIALGPCWEREKLEEFFETLHGAMVEV